MDLEKKRKNIRNEKFQASYASMDSRRKAGFLAVRRAQRASCSSRLLSDNDTMPVLNSRMT